MTTILPKPLPLRWCECPTDRQRPALDDDYVGEYDVVDECHVGDNTDENTGKLHLVIDDTEAEHVRIGHQHFLVLDNIAINQHWYNHHQHCHLGHNHKNYHYHDQTLSG